MALQHADQGKEERHLVFTTEGFLRWFQAWNDQPVISTAEVCWWIRPIREFCWGPIQVAQCAMDRVSVVKNRWLSNNLWAQWNFNAIWGDLFLGNHQGESAATWPITHSWGGRHKRMRFVRCRSMLFQQFSTYFKCFSRTNAPGRKKNCQGLQSPIAIGSLAKGGNSRQLTVKPSTDKLKRADTSTSKCYIACYTLSIFGFWHLEFHFGHQGRYLRDFRSRLWFFDHPSSGLAMPNWCPAVLAILCLSGQFWSFLRSTCEKMQISFCVPALVVSNLNPIGCKM